MKLFKFLYSILILVVVISCECKTNTPIEFLNKHNTSEAAYARDIKKLEKETLHYIDSIGKQKTPISKVTNVDVFIDTVFYNNENKIVFLAITKRINPYVKLKSGDEYKDGIDYYGNCFIGNKDSSYINIIHKLNHSVNSDEPDGYSRVKKKLRKIYLCEMNNGNNRYNINDMRFWDSKVWEEAEIMNAKMKRYLKKKKTNPEDVYPR